MTDPNPIVECVAPNGAILYRRKSSAQAWGLKITGGRATDGHDRPLPDKPKVNLPKAKPAPQPNKEN